MLLITARHLKIIRRSRAVDSNGERRGEGLRRKGDDSRSSVAALETAERLGAVVRVAERGRKRRRIGMRARRRAERISSEKLTRDAAKTMSRVARDIPNC